MTNFTTKTKNAESESAKSNGIKRKSNDLQADSINESAPLFGFPIQRKAGCACGGGCPTCQSSSSNLPISQPNDASEIEADVMADKVMRMPIPEPINFSSGKNSVQKKCDHCEEEEKQLHRKESNSESVSAAPSIVNDVLSSGGRSLDANTRSFMESRFNYDFGNLKIHDDNKAAESASSINALAYTSGNSIVFNSGQYNPNSDSGKRLLAHELTHVVQQNSGVNPKLIQRTLIVDPRASVPASSAAGNPIPLTTAVQGLLDQTCAAGRFRVNATTGVVSSRQAFCVWHPPFLPGVTEADTSSTPVGCGCLCNVVNHAHTTTVDFRPGGPGASPGSQPGAGPGHDGVQTDSGVFIDPRFQGQYRINGNWVDVPFFLLFSHELCGHALPKMQGTHAHRGPAPAGGTPPQERHSVDVERDIANEQGLPSRPEDYSGAARERP